MGRTMGEEIDRPSGCESDHLTQDHHASGAVRVTIPRSGDEVQSENEPDPVSLPTHVIFVALAAEPTVITVPAGAHCQKVPGGDPTLLTRSHGVPRKGLEERAHGIIDAVDVPQIQGDPEKSGGDALGRGTQVVRNRGRVLAQVPLVDDGSGSGDDKPVDPGERPFVEGPVEIRQEGSVHSRAAGVGKGLAVVALLGLETCRVVDSRGDRRCFRGGVAPHKHRQHRGSPQERAC